MESTEQKSILKLPSEVLLLILDLVDIPDIISIRQTCTTLSKATYERTVWMKIAHEQVEYLPLPPRISNSLKDGDDRLQGYSNSSIESVVRNARRTEEAWLRPRDGAFRKLKREKFGSLLVGLELLADRWLLAIYAESAIYLFDTQPWLVSSSNPNSAIGYDAGKGSVQEPILRAFLALETTPQWTSHSAAMDRTEGKLVVAVSCSHLPFNVQLYEVDLAFLSSTTLTIRGAFRQIRTITSPLNKIIRDIDLSQRLIITSTSSLVEVVGLDDEHATSPNPPGKAVIRIQPEDIEDLWNGVVAARFMGPYILIFKTRSLEMHQYTSLLIPTNNNAPTKTILKQSFSMTFRDVSFSQCSVSHNTILETETYERTLFAYDVIHGLFRYVIGLTLPLSPSSKLPPALEVSLVGVYPLALSLNLPNHSINIHNPSPSNQLSTAIQAGYLHAYSPSPTPTFTHSLPRNQAFSGPLPTSSSHTATTTRLSQSDANSRGFVSTHRVGPQGKRAVWVERKRSGTAREVQVWSLEPPIYDSSSMQPSDDVDMLSDSQRVEFSGPLGSTPSVMEIEKRVVYSVQSYDLRDDVICCTLGELSGTIVLGHRSGDISLLDLY